MKKRTLLLLLSLLPLSMTAQQKFLLRGQVVDAANDSPVSFATTALLRDSTAVAAVAADAQGRFELSAEAAGDYRLQITMVGYNPETQPVTLRTAATDAGTIRLRQGVDIDQVTVTIQKPLVTADAEKTTYSVEDDPQAASSTLEEILRKVPQLTIDAEGNVKLNGQSDFKVLVNGRSSAMFKNFKDVIRSMPASQIKKIEVITEPSMKYDAEGAGGIINIITARKEFDGYNGSLNYNTGLDTRQQYGGASLSVQKGKFAASVQAFFFQMNRRNRPYTSESRRENFASEQQRYHTSESTGYGKGHNEYVTLNLSYQPDTLNLVTLEGSLWTGAWKNSSDTRIRMSDAAETPTVAYDTHDYDNYPYTGFQVGANYERRFRKPEHTLTVSDMVEIDPDKGYNLVTYDGVLNYPSSQLYKRHTSRSFTNTFQLDYYNPLAEHHYVEAGSKYIYRINKGYQNEIPWIDPVGFDPTNMTKYDDLRQRQQKDRAQQVRLHFQCVVALIAGTERRVFAGPAELFLVEQPVPQLMGAGKAQPPGRCFLFAERAVDEDGAALDGKKIIAVVFSVIDRCETVVKDCLAQNPPIIPQILILQHQPLCLDDVLNGNGCGGTVIKSGVIGGDHIAGDPLQRLFAVICFFHASISPPSLDFFARWVIRSINSCHSWSVASASFAVRSAARTISRSMM